MLTDAHITRFESGPYASMPAATIDNLGWTFFADDRGILYISQPSLAGTPEWAVLPTALRPTGFKLPVRFVATAPTAYTASADKRVLTENAAAAGFGTHDGIASAATNEFLLADGTANAGVYVLTTLGSGAVKWVATRRADADCSDEIRGGMVVPVETGTVYGGKLMQLTTSGTISMGVTALTFASVQNGALSAAVNDANNATVVTVGTLTHSTTGAAAIGIGTGLLFQAENDGATNSDLMDIKAVTTDVTAPVAADCTIELANGTALTEAVRIKGLTSALECSGTSPGITATGVAASIPIVFAPKNLETVNCDVTNAATNTMSLGVVVRRSVTGGVGAIGIGTGIEYEVEDDGGVLRPTAQITTTTTDVTNPIASGLAVNLANGTAVTEVLGITPLGETTATVTNAATNDVRAALVARRSVTGAGVGAIGIGARIRADVETDVAGVFEEAGRIDFVTTDVTTPIASGLAVSLANGTAVTEVLGVSPMGQTTATITNAATNDVRTALTLRRSVTGAGVGAIGIGARQTFEVETDAAGTFEEAGRIAVAATDVTTPVAADLTVSLANGTAVTDVLAITGLGEITGTVTNATTNDVRSALILRRGVLGGSGAAGIGCRQQFQVENDAGAFQPAVYFDAVAPADVTADLVADLVVSVANNAAPAERMRLTGAGDLTVTRDLNSVGGMRREERFQELNIAAGKAAAPIELAGLAGCGTERLVMRAGSITGVSVCCSAAVGTVGAGPDTITVTTHINGGGAIAALTLVLSSATADQYEYVVVAKDTALCTFAAGDRITVRTATTAQISANNDLNVCVEIEF